MSVAKLQTLSQSQDPKAALFASLGDLSDVQVYSGRVLVAIYISPEKTSGGIIRPTSAIREDVWQGTIGLVVKKGPLAFQDDDSHKFQGQTVEVGDWVMFRPGDTTRLQIRELNCRIVEDVLIQMKISDPEIITYRSL